MIGKHAFCPTSGASLSREAHYDEHGRPMRAPTGDECRHIAACETPLTTGSRRSSKRALTTYFRRCHQRHAEASDELYRRAAFAIHQLKRTATDHDGRDVVVWYALSERLAHEGFDVAWMSAHVEPRCPTCGGRLSYEMGPNGPLAWCGTRCSDEKRDRLETIRDTVVSLYERTFHEDASLTADDLTLL